MHLPTLHKHRTMMSTSNSYHHGHTAVLLSVVLLAACADANATTGRDSARATAAAAAELTADPVSVTLATPGDDISAATVVATGTYASRDEIPLGFKIGGVVHRVLVDEGAVVQRGQVLAVLDLREIDAAVAKAQVQVDKATRDQARLLRLVADSVATTVQLQDATSALDAARADLASARVNREYATIVAPEAGTVLQRQVTPGATVAPGASMFVLGGARRGRVLRAGLPDRDALRVQAGDSASVHFDALPGQHFAGRVVLIGRSADPRTGTYSVEVALRDAERLPSGLVGEMRVHLRDSFRTRGAAADRGMTPRTLPADALLEADGDSATIYVLRDGASVTAAGDSTYSAARQRVAVLGIDGDRVQVQGVAADARVVARGAPYVTPGTRLRVVAANVSSRAAATRDVSTRDAKP